jgi:hypothetical protein
MTNPLTPYPARAVIHERRRSPQGHRSQRLHTYTMPVARELPRPVRTDTLASSGW